MTSRPLADFEIRTLPGLWRWYETASRQLAFTAQTRADTERWQAALREQLARLLGGFPVEGCDLAPVVIETVEDDGFSREKIVIQTLPGEYMPCYILTPRGETAPYQPLIALHGHGTWGAKSIVGIDDNPAAAEYSKVHNYDYARQMVRLGYQVFAPELRAFGERMEPHEIEQQRADPRAVGLNSCERVAINALLSGKTLMGSRVWDVMRLIDHIHSRPDVVKDRLPCIGLSGGGTATMYTAALDERITCAYISGAVSTFRDSILSIDHCLCNHIPHILEYAEMDEITGLIAPRPLVVEHGLRDPIFPPKGVEAAAATLRRIYACFGAENHFTVHSFDDAHRWDGAPLQVWLTKYL